jgi:glyceraldehyde 3-phosphate dehydrogenase
MTRVAINGFGRIGKLVFKLLIHSPEVEIVAINDLTDIASLVHLLKYDSVHGRFDANIEIAADGLIVDGKKVKIVAEPNPAQIPWKTLDIDIVIESTGLFTHLDDASKHIEAGAKQVIISAPGKGEVPTFVLGVNDHLIDPKQNVISNASCTTNCLAPIAKILDDNFGIEKGFLSTVHAYTADQNLQDAPHKKDMRRARAAAYSIIPTTTGAAAAVGKVLPHLDGKFEAMAMRVPVPDGSLIDLSLQLNKHATVEELNAAIKAEAEGALKGIVEYTEDPIVSIDIIGNPHSAIFDASLTKAMGNFVKVIAWYDNEAGYANRVADLIKKINK